MSLNEVQSEVILSGVRWSRNILAELLGRHSRSLNPKCHTCLREAITALTDFEHAMGDPKDVPSQTEDGPLGVYLIESSDKNGDDLNCLIVARGRERANDLFEKKYGRGLRGDGAWGVQEVQMDESIRKL